MGKTAKEDFIELMTENVKSNGFNELASRIMGILFVEPDELPLGELAKRTGYSLSAISTEIKFIENAGLVKRVKKPKSRKVFFYMKKDMINIGMDILRRKYEQVLLKSKNIIPEIIDKYKKLKNPQEKRELQILEKYYKQVLKEECVFKKLIFLFGRNKKGVKWGQ